MIVDAITPNSLEVVKLEDLTITLSCNFSSANYLFWYRQYPGSEPHFLINVYNEAVNYSLDSRLSGDVNKERTQLYLKITSAKLSDSAVYYCAMKPTVSKTGALSYKNHPTITLTLWGTLSPRSLCCRNFPVSVCYFVFTLLLFFYYTIINTRKLIDWLNDFVVCLLAFLITHTHTH